MILRASPPFLIVVYPLIHLICQFVFPVSHTLPRRVIVRGMGIKEREPFNLHFQFALCLYLPCSVPCHGNEEGGCNQPVPTRLCEAPVSHAQRCYWGVRFPGTTSHVSFLFCVVLHRTLAPASLPFTLQYCSDYKLKMWLEKRKGYCPKSKGMMSCRQWAPEWTGDRSSQPVHTRVAMLALCSPVFSLVGAWSYWTSCMSLVLPLSLN